MTTFVMVHGAWGGNHSWRDFAPILWRAGHEVFTPSLTGLGERTHLAGPSTDLSLHIRDVAACIEYNDLNHIVLVGHSYGGMVITGVADILADRIDHLVYEDAFVPRDGESCWPAERVARSVAEDGWSIMRQDPGEPVSTVEASYRMRRSAQPARTFDEPVRLTMPTEQRPFTRTYVKAGGHPRTPIEGQDSFFWDVARRLSADPAWRYFELPCGHGIHRELPNEFAGILLSLAK